MPGNRLTVSNPPAKIHSIIESYFFPPKIPLPAVLATSTNVPISNYVTMTKCLNVNVT